MSRKSGTDTDATRNAIIQAAFEEFSTRGFDDASLRAICKKANVTTGAMYGMFEDKEELFTCIVSPITSAIIERFKEHLAAEAANGMDDLSVSEQEDFRAAEAILSLYYDNKEVADLILKNTDRPCITEFFDEIVHMMQEQMELMLKILPENFKGRSNLNECTLHWFAHVQLDSVLHIISHDYEKERAVEQFKIIIKFLRSGILGLALNE